MGVYPRTEKQSTGLFFAHCGTPSEFDSSPSGHKLNTPYRETVGGVYLGRVDKKDTRQYEDLDLDMFIFYFLVYCFKF